MDGIIIIDKPAGLTSHNIVARVRRILGQRRVGHTGTLDPFATGVLVVLVGRATRLAQFLAGADKEYEAVIRFGYATDTGDITGERRPTNGMNETLERSPAVWSEQEVKASLQDLCGQIEQVPPMYSAKKVKGQKLYELARRGEEIERRPVRVTIYEFEAEPRDGKLLQDNSDGTYDLAVRVACSAGTYIRTLAETVGERLGTPAHLASLRRMRAGDFKIEEAKSLEELEEIAKSEKGPASILLSPDAALSSMPFVHLTAEEARRACNGAMVRVNPVKKLNWEDKQRVRMRDEYGNLIAIGTYDVVSSCLQPQVVLGG